MFLFPILQLANQHISEFLSSSTVKTPLKLLLLSTRGKIYIPMSKLLQTPKQTPQRIIIKHKISYLVAVQPFHSLLWTLVPWNWQHKWISFYGTKRKQKRLISVQIYWWAKQIIVSRQVAGCWWYFMSRFKDSFTAKLFFQDNFLKRHININNDNNNINPSKLISISWRFHDPY